jgi:hypothetical protein
MTPDLLQSIVPRRVSVRPAYGEDTLHGEDLDRPGFAVELDARAFARSRAHPHQQDYDLFGVVEGESESHPFYSTVVNA